jgi:hypothetical protein
MLYYDPYYSYGYGYDPYSGWEFAGLRAPTPGPPGPPPPPPPGACAENMMWDSATGTCVPVLPWPIQQNTVTGALPPPWGVFSPGSAGSGQYEASVAQSAFQNLAYPMGDYFVGDWEGNEYAGLDLGTISSYGKQIGQKLGDWGSQAGQALGIHPGSSDGFLGDAPARMSTASDAAKAAADEARSAMGRLGETADHARATAKSVKEAADVAKYAIIGLGILGGAALIYYIAKD